MDLNHAEIIDIFPQYSILTFRLSSSTKIILPKNVVLNSLMVSDDSNRSIQYSLAPSDQCEAPDKLSIVRVIKDGQVLSGKFIDQHKCRVTILDDSQLITFFKPDMIEVLEPIRQSILTLINAENEVTLKFRLNTIRMDVNYLVNLEDSRMSIRPRYRIINDDSTDRSYGKISLHSRDINAFEPGRKLLNINGDLTLTSDGLLIDLLEPIEADYQKYYEHGVNTGQTNLICEFIPNDELTSGPAEFYRNNRYSGSGELPSTSKDVIGRIDLGKTKLSVSSMVSEDVIDDQNVINIRITVAEQLDEKIMIAVIYKADKDVVAYGAVKPGKVDGRKVTWRIGFGTSKQSQSVTVQLGMPYITCVKVKENGSRSSGKTSIKRMYGGQS